MPNLQNNFQTMADLQRQFEASGFLAQEEVKRANADLPTDWDEDRQEDYRIENAIQAAELRELNVELYNMWR